MGPTNEAEAVFGRSDYRHLKEVEAGVAVTDLCRRRGMSSATYHEWKAKFGGLDVSDARRLRALEEENDGASPGILPVLNLVDDVIRECLATVLDTSISDRRGVRELGDLIARCGAPKMIVSDDVLRDRLGPRDSRSLDRRLQRRSATLLARLRHPSGVRRRTRKATGGVTLVRCFACAYAQHHPSVSGRRWMKDGDHVTIIPESGRHRR